MTIFELYDELIRKFLELPGVTEFLGDEITVVRDENPEPALMPWNYIPFKDRRPEYRVTASFRGTKGEAYTETPENFEGSLKEAISIPPSENGIDARTVAAINAVMCHLGYCAGTFPTDFDERRLYSEALFGYVLDNYGKKNIVLIGYDGYLVKKMVSDECDFWTLDRDPDNISQDRFKHVVVNSGRFNREACFAWGKIFIITGSTLCNGTIVQYLEQGKNLLFYGITCAGTARLLNLPWFEVKVK